MDTSFLEEFLAFSDEDLAANRDGRLSPGQSLRLRGSGTWRLVAGPLLTVGAVVAALLTDNGLYIAVALAVAGLGFYVTWQGFAFLADSLDGAVAFLTAPIRVRAVRGKYGMTYWADIGPVTKKISSEAYESLPDGHSCHLYYAPGCRSLLSTEPVSAAEPKPDHAFGPDSAHVWDRLRWSWVLMTIGVLGVLIAAHAVAVAHPAEPIAVEGTVADYVETHGKSTSRDLYLSGDSSAYILQREDFYAPQAPPFATLIGKNVVLYIDAGTRNVIALNDGDQRYATDWYLHPDHKAVFEATNGAGVGAVAVVTFLVGIGMLTFGRRRFPGAVAGDPNVPRQLYAPPTVRPVQANLSAVLLVAAVIALGVFTVGLASHR